MFSKSVDKLRNPKQSLIFAHRSSSLSRSEVNLHNIGGDIKNRIDMYINGLYDNELLNHYSDNFNQFVDESIHGVKNTGNRQTEELKQDSAITVTMPVMEGHQTTVRRPHSISSDIEARGSTSDSTDSGLGVYGNGNQEIAKAMMSSSVTYPPEILSPPMSELERRSRLMLRNGSLNDIHHLMGQQDTGVIDSVEDANGYEYSNEIALDLPVELTPRFCHECGTKYPNTLAKFCYECGNRRFAVGELSVES